MVTDENATVVRYTLTSSGTLEKSGSVSFSGKGVSSLGEYQNNFQFISATIAYYFDGTTAQVIIWNPTGMTVTGSIPLDSLAIQGAILSFSGAAVRLTNQVIMPMGWCHRDEQAACPRREPGAGITGRHVDREVAAAQGGRHAGGHQGHGGNSPTGGGSMGGSRKSPDAARTT